MGSIIETKEIEMTSKEMLALLFILNGIPWFVVSLTGVLILVLLGIIIDPRFYILTLIWIFLFAPLVIAFLYFYYGMMPLTAFNTIPHKLEFQEQTITVKFFEETEEGKRIDIQKDYMVEKKQLSKIKTGSDFLILFFNKKGWLWIPMECLNIKNKSYNILDLIR